MREGNTASFKLGFYQGSRLHLARQTSALYSAGGRLSASRRRMDFETRVKLGLYKTIAETAQVPTVGRLAEVAELPLADVEAALRGLARAEKPS